MPDHSLTTADLVLLQEILDLSHIPAGVSPAETMHEVLERVQTLVGCDAIIVHVRHEVPEPQQRWASQRPPPEWSEGNKATTTLGTWSTALEWSEHWSVSDSVQEEAQLLLSCSTGPGASICILAPREHGTPYGSREITLLELLLPHLRPLVTAVYGPPEAAPPPTLTRRQVDILELVRLGMANREISRRLGLSEGTVRKHLEHVYARLGVLNRTEAVSAYFDASTPTAAPSRPAGRREHPADRDDRTGAGPPWEVA